MPPRGRELLHVIETARPLFRAEQRHRRDTAVRSTWAGCCRTGAYLFVVSGYGMFRQMPGNMLLAWALPPTRAREETP
jgi:hypothetical protein